MCEVTPDADLSLTHGVKYTKKFFKKNNKKKLSIPAPGIEPGPAGWEPAILTPRPCRITYFYKQKNK